MLSRCKARISASSARSDGSADFGQVRKRPAGPYRSNYGETGAIMGAEPVNMAVLDVPVWITFFSE